MPKSFCAICGKQVGSFLCLLTADKQKICSKCFSAAGSPNVKKFTVEQVEELIRVEEQKSAEVKAEKEKEIHESELLKEQKAAEAKAAKERKAKELEQQKEQKAQQAAEAKAEKDRKIQEAELLKEQKALESKTSAVSEAVAKETPKCAICGINLDRQIKYKIADGQYVCLDCQKRSGSLIRHNMTVSEAKALIDAKEHNAEELKNFNSTKKIDGYLEIDEHKKKWLIPSGLLGGKKRSTVYNYSDIVDFELLEDGSSINQGGTGRALVGGALFGAAGAIVGAAGKRKVTNVCNNLQIKITLNSVTNPTAYIRFISFETKKDSFSYRTSFKCAQDCLSILNIICNELTAQTAPAADTGATAASSPADEILKFKKLLDSGAITSEEYNAKKKQLLNL